jgi:anaerobic magnesium-protoporphyrin IX monomethyl ester cyclase
MNVTLVYPAIAGWGFNCYKRNLETSWLSHGLSILSAIAKARGHEVRLQDLRRLKSWKEFGEGLRDQQPKVVGVYVSSVDYNPALQAIAHTKKILPQATVLVGGPHPSLVPEEFLENPFIDHIFVGEAELSFPRFLEEFAQGHQLDQRVIIGEKPDLDRVPFIDRTLFGPHETSPSRELLPEPFMSTIAGRGCFFHCRFCQPAEARIFGKKVRRRSVENVMEELRFLKDAYGLQSFIMHDDCLTESKNWVFSWCDSLRREGLRAKFMCQSRADLVCKNPDLIREMAGAGLELLIIGFESGSQRVLDFLGKGTTVAQNFEAARICRQLGVKIWGNYMLGIPTETREEVRETVRMMRTIKPHIYAPSFFTPHVGSQLYDYCLAQGLWAPTSHDDFRRNAAGPKIKGVDYDFLFRALELSKNRPLPERMAKWLARKTLGTENLLTTFQFLGRFARKLRLKND